MTRISPILVAVWVVLLLGAQAARADWNEKARFLGADEELKRVLFDTVEPLLPSDRDGYRDLYVGTGDSIAPVSFTRRAEKEEGITWEARWSRDLKAVAFETSASLSRRDRDEVRDVYLWLGKKPVPIFPGTEDGVRVVEISDDGSTVLIDTREPLTQEDVDSAKDTYSWRDGQVELITSGTMRRGGVSAVEIVPSGETVFIETGGPLVSEDTDGRQSDIYRVENGSASLVSTGPADPHAGGVRYWSASAEGAEVVFTTESSLTSDDANGSDDVYLWAGGQVERMSPDPLEPNLDEFFFLRTAHEVGRSIVVEASGRLALSDVDDKRDLYALTPESAEHLLPNVTGGHFGFASRSMAGDRIIVESGAPFLPADENQKDDLYAWDKGTDDLSLLTPGSSERGIFEGFVGANPAATRVMFETRENIDPRDTDRNSLDVYVVDDGEFTFLSDAAFGNPTYSYGVATSRDARSAIVQTFGRFSAEDSDGQEDLYRVSLDGAPELVSGP